MSRIAHHVIEGTHDTKEEQVDQPQNQVHPNSLQGDIDFYLWIFFLLLAVLLQLRSLDSIENIDIN